MRQCADDRLAEPRLDLEPVGLVEDHVEHRPHVVDPAVVARDDLDQLRRRARHRGLVPGKRRRIRPCAGREVGQVAADVVEHCLVVLADVVDHSAGYRDTGSAEVFLRDVLSGRLFDDGRPGSEDRALHTHDPEVAHRGDQGAMSG